MYKLSSNPQLKPVIKNDFAIAQVHTGENRWLNDSNKVIQNPQYFKQENEND